jgi:hypothetical protein
MICNKIVLKLKRTKVNPPSQSFVSKVYYLLHGVIEQHSNGFAGRTVPACFCAHHIVPKSLSHISKVTSADRQHYAAQDINSHELQRKVLTDVRI